MSDEAQPRDSAKAERLAPRDPRVDAGRRARLLAAVSIAAALPLLAYAVHSSTRAHENEAQRDPLDPATTNAAELLRVHEAVSRVLAAAPSAMPPAIETLESVRAESPGARDLKDACVNTYRGLLRAQAAEHVARELLMLPDGGERSAETVSPAERIRAMESMREATEQTELVTQSHERCHTLYAQASERLHVPSVERAIRR